MLPACEQVGVRKEKVLPYKCDLLVVKNPLTFKGELEDRVGTRVILDLSVPSG